MSLLFLMAVMETIPGKLPRTTDCPTEGTIIAPKGAIQGSSPSLLPAVTPSTHCSFITANINMG